MSTINLTHSLPHSFVPREMGKAHKYFKFCDLDRIPGQVSVRNPQII